MPKIRCHYLDCLFLDERYCSAAAIELNPDTGCQTYTPDEETELGNWEEEEELDEWEAMGTPEEIKDDWDDDDDDDDLDDDQDSY
ncbi:MAG TPA: hypothetical protein PLO92_01385 [Anaerolineaceae bacterium]|jgi:hypothetical protein|nr:hypothetical protein [Anaerolineales bacterium]HOG58309.1 hypothetical protein [Anaerolineaceae bacterium]HOR83102.1 hypothetical protein [Anaerolineaceae bacterium]HPL43007.1 hypothetical protein [Anaerolineaceae bacterium]HPY32986.1 hypothetical protein [Anaerolineaceae bacterium]